MRGAILILFGILALYRAFTLHSGQHAWAAYALGAAALALGAWHVIHLRRDQKP
jgi:hypothetical protein